MFLEGGVLPPLLVDGVGGFQDFQQVLSGLLDLRSSVLRQVMVAGDGDEPLPGQEDFLLLSFVKVLPFIPNSEYVIGALAIHGNR